MPPLPDLRHVRVWIVEDDVDFRDAFEDVVGPQVSLEGVFGSVEAAIARLDVAPHAAPDVMMLDVNLPGLTGIEGLGALKSRAPSTFVVMLTIRDDAATIAQALGAGASGYVLKGAPPDLLLAAIDQASRGGMLMEPAVARAVLSQFEARPPTPDYGLTDRERDVLREMVAGGTQREIADRLFVSPSTVNTHVQHVYEKLHVHSGSAAVAKAIRERLLEG
ncbi:response regulator [Rubrivirga sp. IMCC45206]|uniref:response regulator n=1 Tax=Rubrivirga sp. IMCC45206 TaxID=3391614 RepID=UPI0039902AD3